MNRSLSCITGTAKKENPLSLHIVRLCQDHLEDAAALACARYRALRQEVPQLPPRYEEVGAILPLLQPICEQGPGVAAFSGGRLAGYLAAWLIPEFRGKPTVFSPEWANGAELDDSRRLYAEMYAHLAAQWVGQGFYSHVIALLANDREGIDGWHWLGFGLVAADGVRGLQPPSGPLRGPEIRRATVQDIDLVTPLARALDRHLAAAPTFLLREEEETRERLERWLRDPANALWLACEGAEAVAYMRQGPASTDACTIIRDEGTTSIVGAYTEPQARGRGVATALLARALEWGRDQGYQRCAVDFEPMNILAARFWPAHFRLVSLALHRQVDERAGRF